MSYLNQTDPRSRATAIIGVGVVHAALAAGLMLGLAVAGYKTSEPKLTVVPIKPEPTAAPEPVPSHSNASLPNFTTPMPPLPLPPLAQPSIEVSRSDSQPIEPFLIPGPTPSIAVTPSPTASFAPKGAVPRTSPGSWITNDDYPARALRFGEEGLTRYRLAIGSDGKVSGCEITASSGSGDLDRETCRLLVRRAQFEPATDQNGARPGGTYSGSVRWDIPE
jgi:protein TonB